MAVTGICVVVLIAALVVVLHLGGDAAPRANPSAVAGVAGATHMGPFSIVLPHSVGTWSPEDTADIAATAEESDYVDGKLPEMFEQRTVDMDSDTAATVLVTIFPKGARTVDTIDETTALFEEQFPGSVITDVTWTGTLKARAKEADMGGIGHMAIVFVELPDGRVASIGASGISTLFANGEFTAAILNATYTG